MHLGGGPRALRGRLGEEEAANHYAGIACVTTKAGLTRTMEEQAWCGEGASADALRWFPRSYTLDDAANRDAFVVKESRVRGAARAYDV